MIDITQLNMDHPIHHQSNIFLLQLLAGFIHCYCHYQVCNLPADWEACSWKGQLGKSWIWKVFSWIAWHGIGKNEIGKFAPKLESSGWSWKVDDEVGKFLLNLESYNCSWKDQKKLKPSNFSDNFPNSFKLWTFQLQNFSTSAKLSNFARFFPTSLGSFQLKQKLSNFSFFHCNLQLDVPQLIASKIPADFKWF